MFGIVGEKERQAVKIPPSTRVLPGNVVVLHSLDIHTELKGMRSMGPECIVRELVIVKGMLIVGSRCDATLISCKSSNSYGRRGLSRGAAQAQIRRGGINGPGGDQVERVTAAVTNSRGIDEAGTECVALFENDGLPPGL